MFDTFKLPISWREVAVRTFKETMADNVLDLAAQLAYYFLLALVPAIVFFVALTSFFPPGIIDQLMAWAADVMPADMLGILQDQMDAIRGREQSGILSVGLLMALWSSSAAMVSASDALNCAYDIEEARPWWKVCLNAIGMTVALTVFVLVASTLVIAGPEIAESLAARLGLGAAFTTVWNVVQWPVAFLLVVVAIALVNYLGPDAEQDWEWITPGAVLATMLWLLTSLGFRVYVTSFGDYNGTYGSLGGVIVLMLWFYLSSLAVLVGAELNAEIEHASPHGQARGEKVPGQRTTIGARARRAWRERQQG